ncbi:MAG: hypothetical protein V3U76_06500 [Granulosicoccus sp.]
MNSKAEKRIPNLTASYKVGEKTWINCGAAWAHGNGKGYNIKLNSFPVGGEFSLFERKVDEQEQEAS